MKYLALSGRILFSLIFILAAPSHFSSSTINHAATQGVPFAPILVPFAGILALFGGLSILLGFKARQGAILIIFFLIPVTVMMHNFWNVHDMQARQIQQIMFMKNISILGSSFLIGYFGAGVLSVDQLLKKIAQKRMQAKGTRIQTAN